MNDPNDLEPTDECECGHEYEEHDEVYQRCQQDGCDCTQFELIEPDSQRHDEEVEEEQ